MFELNKNNENDVFPAVPWEAIGISALFNQDDEFCVSPYTEQDHRGL